MWKLVWNNHVALKPSIEIGVRPKLLGGISFIDPQQQFTALLAQWPARYLREDMTTLWQRDLYHNLQQFVPGGWKGLSAKIPRSAIKKMPPGWRPILDAWNTMQPEWMDLEDISLESALALPVKDCIRKNNLSGAQLKDLLTYDRNVNTYRLLTPSEVQKSNISAVDKKRRMKAISSWRHNYLSYPSAVTNTICSATQPTHAANPQIALKHFGIAKVSVSLYKPAVGRWSLIQNNVNNHKNSLSYRKITEIGNPPDDIWQAVYHPARSPAQREVFYKFLYNALPLASRTAHWNAGNSHCYTCPDTDQSLQHFIHDCTLAQVAWKHAQACYAPQISITPSETAFAFPACAYDFSVGYTQAFRIHAIHAVVISTLWTMHTKATFQKVVTPCSAVCNLLRTALQQYLNAERARAIRHRQLSDFDNLWRDIVHIRNDKLLLTK
jgi:hypothetical protein